MRIVRMLGNSRVAVETAADPVCGEGEVVVRIRASGLCGSELHGYRADHAQASNGGHEAMGEVVEVRGAKRLRVGDRVGIHAVWGCGACEPCAAGRYTWCANRRVPGGFHADLVAAPEHVLLPLGEDMPDAVGVLLSGDGLGVPYHVQSRLRSRPGDRVCVVGCGPIGLGNVLMQSHVGAHVVALDVSDYRLSLASALGAAHAVNTRTADPVEAVRDLLGGAALTACMECVGRPETLKTALRLVGNGGTVMAVGEQGPVPVDISEELIRRDIALIGSWFFHFGEFADMAAAFRAGLPVEKLVTHRFGLAEADTAFSEFAGGRTGKALLIP